MIARIYMSIAEVILRKGNIDEATKIHCKATSLIENFYCDNIMMRIIYKRKEA